MKGCLVAWAHDSSTTCYGETLFHDSRATAPAREENINKIDKKTLAPLQAYNWPGNIRELQNVIERAVILCDGETLSIDEGSVRGETAGMLQIPASLTEALISTEKTMIEAALEETGGRVAGPSGAAVKLGIPRTTLESKIRGLRIDKQLFRSERRPSAQGMWRVGRRA